LKKDIIPADDLADQDKIKQGAYIKHVQEIAEIVAKIETMAFADGYYLALGLASGGCKDFLCRDNLCQVIDGGRCPYPLKARPSMEAASIDVFGLVASVGWEGYPIYATIDPKLVPLAILVGLIFVY
jgi:predicted metal-binding protein